MKRVDYRQPYFATTAGPLWAGFTDNLPTTNSPVCPHC